jgi:DNA-binding NarL/FixJ family response regulator
MGEKIQIYIVDDHAVLRAGLKLLLNAELDMQVVGEAPDIQQASREISAIFPDVVLLDVSLPQVTGLEGLETLQKCTPNSRFLILTMHNDEQYLRLALAHGAMGYVTKQAANEELLSAIRIVAQGGTYLHFSHRNILFSKSGELTTEEEIVTEKNIEDLRERLSPRELEILILIARGYTNRQAAEELFLSEKTIETYKSRLMNKLSLKSRIELVRFAIQHRLITS